MTELEILKSGVAVKFEKVTLYRSGEMMGNYSAIECREVTLRVTKYAQYDNAIEITFLKKGARKARRMMMTDHASLVVVDGYRAFVPDGIFGAAETVTHADGGTVSVSKGRHSGFGAGWRTDFVQGLAAWVSENPGRNVRIDFHGWNAYRGEIEKD